MDLQELLELARQAEADGRAADRDRLMDMYFKSEAEASASAINVPEGKAVPRRRLHHARPQDAADALYEPRGRIFNARCGNYNEHHPRGRRFQKSFGR